MGQKEVFRRDSYEQSSRIAEAVQGFLVASAIILFIVASVAVAIYTGWWVQFLAVMGGVLVVAWIVWSAFAQARGRQAINIDQANKYNSNNK